MAKLRRKLVTQVGRTDYLDRTSMRPLCFERYSSRSQGSNNYLAFFHRVVMLESHLVQSGTLTESDGADLYILAGHEASY